jgi:hypothetical protein
MHGKIFYFKYFIFSIKFVANKTETSKYITGNVYGNITQRSLYAETYKCELLGLALGRTSQQGSDLS